MNRTVQKAIRKSSPYPGSREDDTFYFDPTPSIRCWVGPGPYGTGWSSERGVHPDVEVERYINSLDATLRMAKRWLVWYHKHKAEREECGRPKSCTKKGGHQA